MELQPRRRSDRVSYESAIRVFGTDVGGTGFIEEGGTLVLSRHGAAIILKRKLCPHQVIIIRCETGKEADARVVGQIGRKPAGRVYGVAFLDATVNLWEIDFPPPSESEDAVGHVLLECGHCRSRELVCLDEFEVEVFEASRSISRACKHCQDTTHWKEAAPEPPKEVRPLQVESPAEARQLPPPPSPPPRTENERQHVRAKTRVKALIRHAGLGEEIIATENVSRGGLCFRSRKGYYVGSRIEVALPYSPGPANIFVPARIVRTQELPGEYLLAEYGAEYIKSSRAERATQQR
jgi:hypothetical protein